MALREAREELGIQSIAVLQESIFDIDIHLIPFDVKRGLGPHMHYDIRYLLSADSSEQIRICEESEAGRWVDLKKAEELNCEPGIMRFIAKTQPFFH